MPRTTLPPTPAPSGSISGKDASPTSAEEKVFNLPSPAISQRNSSSTSRTPKPIAPAAAPDFSLPPPPTRSRTIIQVKPRTAQEGQTEKKPGPAGPKSTSKKVGSNFNTTAKKQSGSASAAGRKTARKTAHSVIERRRRSKMNEEFAVLKDMIPACTDQDMHKLAILQASIEYLRYLEDCVKNLKDANRSLTTSPLDGPSPPPPSTAGAENYHEENSSDHADDDGDEIMEDAGHTDDTPFMSARTSSLVSALTSPQSTTISPALKSISSTQSSAYAPVSILPPPHFETGSSGQSQKHGPEGARDTAHARSASFSTDPPSASTSPPFLPSTDRSQDQEATAALLMLNQDRRNPPSASSTRPARPLRVKDLLTL